MVVNDLPGEECRIAVVRDQHLEELYTERTSQATSVGNIYKGKVTKVEPAIQAAFIDFGGRQSGFLHITDLHPKYFPGKERAERVGKKIPRRDRPPIQDCLSRGDEVLVQVLKEGIGTKGPTLTSYLSIPGRHMVMMPGMNKVGVSRKVEDDDQRREMRRILDSLDLPDECGFILRTAGLGQNKTELKRDVAYLSRLWKLMDKRIKKVGAPCALYTESDLLIRTIRDVLRPGIEAVIVDSESAYQRAADFLRVVAPRSAPKVIRYTHPTPIFHAFDVERQIELIHNREVPLPSGGALVIEQTEAMVAIDVNSGRSRAARDSETNAYRTNCEAVDEICRQLRLRDLGGLIVNDLIDMRMNRHRRAIEDRFRENLKRDRAKTTTLRISEFGLLEMTRQRMRPSLRKAHFMDCPHCNGRGEIKIPDSVAADAIRQVGYLLQYDRIQRVELVCAPRVATVLLSTKRREMVRLEDASGKSIDVRVSDAFAIDHTEYYAYDDRNADVDVEKLKPLPQPTLEDLQKASEQAEEVGAPEQMADDSGRRKKKKRRRRRKGGPADAAAVALSGGYEISEGGGESESAEPSVNGQAEADGEADGDGDGSTGSKRRKRRRRRRGGKGRQSGETAPTTDAADDSGEQGQPAAAKESSSKKQKGDRSAPKTGKGADDRPVRIHQLARELNVRSKQIVERCQAEGVAVKNHMSTLTAEQIDLVRSWFTATTDDSRPDDTPPSSSVEQSGDDGGEKKGGRSRRGGRRRRRGGRSRSSGSSEGPGGDQQDSALQEGDVAAADDSENDSGRSRRRQKSRQASGDSTACEGSQATSDESEPEESGSRGRMSKKSRKKQQSRRKKGGGESKEPQADGESGDEATDGDSSDTSRTKSSGRKKSSSRSRKKKTSTGASASEDSSKSTSEADTTAGSADDSKQSPGRKSGRRVLYRNRRKPARIAADEAEPVEDR